MKFLRKLFGREEQNEIVPYGGGDIVHEEPRPRLSHLIRVGAQFHKEAMPGTFVAKAESGHYRYEKKTEWFTCAIAAAVVGAGKRRQVEKDFFSYSQACYILHKATGVNINTERIEAPTGEYLPMAQVITMLADEYYWGRREIAGYLEDCGY